MPRFASAHATSPRHRRFTANSRDVTSIRIQILIHTSQSCEHDYEFTCKSRNHIRTWHFQSPRTFLFLISSNFHPEIRSISADPLTMDFFSFAFVRSAPLLRPMMQLARRKCVDRTHDSSISRSRYRLQLFSRPRSRRDTLLSVYSIYDPRQASLID